MIPFLFIYPLCFYSTLSRVSSIRSTKEEKMHLTPFLGTEAIFGKAGIPPCKEDLHDLQVHHGRHILKMVPVIPTC